MELWLLLEEKIFQELSSSKKRESATQQFVGNEQLVFSFFTSKIYSNENEKFCIAMTNVFQLQKESENDHYQKHHNNKCCSRLSFRFSLVFISLFAMGQAILGDFSF